MAAMRFDCWRNIAISNNVGGVKAGSSENLGDDWATSAGSGCFDGISSVDSHSPQGHWASPRVIQAVLPLLWQQGSGHIIGVSSGVGIVAVPLIGFYCASKWTIEALQHKTRPDMEPLSSPPSARQRACRPS